MKRIWTALTLSALLAMGLVGCNDNKTGSDMGTPTPAATQTAQPTPNTALNGTEDSGDLAGPDGMVGDDPATDGALNGGDANQRNSTMGTRTGGGSSVLQGVGQGIENTLDDMGSAARRAGQDAKRALE